MAPGRRPTRARDTVGIPSHHASPILAARALVLSAASPTLAARTLVLSAVLALIPACAGRPAATTSVDAVRGLPGARAVLAEFLRRPELAGARLGLAVRDTATGALLCGWREDEAFPPASTLKLITAAACLDILGPAFRFETGFALYTPPGDRLPVVVVTCGGDPSLGLRQYGGGDEDLAGLDRVCSPLPIRDARRCRLVLVPADGDRIGPRLPGLPPEWLSSWRPGWELGDLVEAWAAPVGPYSWCGNHVTIRLRISDDLLDSSLEPVDAGLVLDTRFVEIAPEGSPKAGSGLFGLRFLRRPGSPEVLVTGRYLGGLSEILYELAVPDAGAYLAEVLTAKLARRGLIVEAEPVLDLSLATLQLEAEAHPEDPARAAFGNLGAPQAEERHRSRPLAELLQLMLSRSDNHCAEQCAWAAGLAAQPGTFPGPVDPQWTIGSKLPVGPPLPVDALLRVALLRRAVSMRSVVLTDASGLSRRNAVPPATLVDLLVALDQERWPAGSGPGAGEEGAVGVSDFAALLPLAGVEGTLTGRFGAESPWHRRMRAKTGTLGGLSALAGYLEPEPGRRLAFAVLLEAPGRDSAALRALVDELCDALYPVLRLDRARAGS